MIIKRYGLWMIALLAVVPNVVGMEEKKQEFSTERALERLQKLSHEVQLPILKEQLYNVFKDLVSQKDITTWQFDQKLKEFRHGGFDKILDSKDLKPRIDFLRNKLVSPELLKLLQDTNERFIARFVLRDLYNNRNPSESDIDNQIKKSYEVNKKLLPHVQNNPYVWLKEPVGPQKYDPEGRTYYSTPHGRVYTSTEEERRN